MPELPEVETIRRGLAPHLEGATITAAIVRNPHLRWPIPDNLPLCGQKISVLTRRAKYLLLHCNSGTLILHLGMSGSLRILPAGTPVIPAKGPSGVPPQPCCNPPATHDHFDLLLDNGKLMRLRDPRRFGAVLWHEGDMRTHPLLSRLGPEPLEDAAGGFDAHHLYLATRNRKIAIKQLIMDNHVVVGVGNIYASEALFHAGISPLHPACNLDAAHCIRLVEAIRNTLTAAIQAGGSTLRDFVNTSGNPGYFQQQHWVYGRAGEPCRICRHPIRQVRQGQRSSFYCETCQQ